MYPFFGSGPLQNSAWAYPFGWMGNDLVIERLPEEVRAAIEEHRDEIRTEDDLRRIAQEYMQRR